MGMDIFGIQPINEKGEYFRSNLWSWRPIHAICTVIIEIEGLKLDTKGWGTNDGHGLQTQEECDIMADGIEDFIARSGAFQEDKDRLYICLGMWVAGSSFLSDNMCTSLNKLYPRGTLLDTQVVTKSGEIVSPAHSVSLEHIKDFITFLRNCGGFSIY